MEQLSKKEKSSIAAALRAYVNGYSSQNKAALSLKNTSAGTVSNILSGKWDNISDEMFRSIAAQIGTPKNQKEWNFVETSAYQEINCALNDAKDFKNVTWVVGEAGCGKTTTARLYTSDVKESYYILCSEDMKRGDFVREIARMIGIRTEGLNIRELWNLIMNDIIQMEAPLLIFDEADKLTEPVFHYFINLYNKLEDKCGVIFMSTDYIKKRISRGLQYQKAGYKEFYSRMGRKFFELEYTSASDVYSICVANGISEKTQIDKIIKECETCDFDLRRVKKSIHRTKKISQ